MSTISVFDMTGNKVSETELSEAVFGITPNEAVMHAMVVNYLANQRQGTQSTLKNRSKRRWQKAMETKGNRSCKTGFNSCSSVVSRRCGSRS